MFYVLSRLLLLSLLLIALFLSSCSNQVKGNPPEITNFTASSTVISAGTSVTLSWTVHENTKLTLKNVGDVSQKNKIVVKPTQSITYELIATNLYGTVNKTLSIQVEDAPVIHSFTSDPAIIEPGQSVNLLWNIESKGNLKLSINQGIGDVTGQTNVNVTPESSTLYTLTAQDEFGSTTAKVLVVAGLDIADLQLSDTTIQAENLQQSPGLLPALMTFL